MDDIEILICEYLIPFEIDFILYSLCLSEGATDYSIILWVQTTVNSNAMRYSFISVVVVVH